MKRIVLIAACVLLAVMGAEGQELGAWTFGDGAQGWTPVHAARMSQLG